MENQIEQKTNAGQGLGIAGLVLGCISIPIAVIPCFGITATLFAVVGIVLSAIGLSQATKRNGSKGLNLAGLILSGLALLIIIAWTLVISKQFAPGGEFNHQIRSTLKEEFSKDFDKQVDDATSEFGDELEKQLEELESDSTIQSEDLKNDKYDKLITDYEELTREFIQLSVKVKEKDLSAVADYAKVAAKATSVATRLMKAAPHMSKSQLSRFDEIQKKYEEALKKAGE
jgi:hypothetical protein